MDNLAAIIEALVFVSEAPLARKKIGDLLPEFSKFDIEAALTRLKQFYEESGRSFVLHEVAEGFQFRTRPEYKDWIRRLKKTVTPRISRSSLETLAIIAYKQPVMRSEIEMVRGVDVSHILKSLLEKNLIRILGRNKDLAGKPLIYGTTQKFLEVFDLRDLSSLPNLKEIKSINQGGGKTTDLFEKS